MRRTILAIVALGAVGLLGKYAWETRYDVPVRLQAVQNTSTSGAPTDTTLHEYIRGSDTTTGRSITLRFPRKDYAWAENAAGGPQYWVELSTLQSSMDGREYRYVRVYSPSKSIAAVAGSAWVRNGAEEGNVRPFAELCGGQAFVRRVAQVVPPHGLPAQMTGDTALSDDTIDLLVLMAQPEVAAECVAHSPVCTVQAPYRTWMMAFHVKRAQLCDWPDMATDIRRILDEHVVTETPPRISSTEP